MPDLSPDPVKESIKCLIAKIGTYAEARVDEISPDALERCSRAISACLKTLRDIESHNLEVASKADNEKYIRYEDLPPLRPDDQARLMGELFQLFHKVRLDEPPTPQFPE